jgi:hypothetical protein
MDEHSPIRLECEFKSPLAHDDDARRRRSRE